MYEFLFGVGVGIFIGQTYKALPNIQEYVTAMLRELDKYKTPNETRNEDSEIRQTVRDGPVAEKTNANYLYSVIFGD